ncbi:PREDICTED: acylamino-acid-releasing enzyme-like [Amphimedon queenslandica]|uniref:Peptidase S9 prolyl oligopeptidase catalytic domain-containing protein n=1 Tax=Amphimedon queenslandica TaxID=400682 RepID=A0AAN0JA89_AMPQE|nr:PREDICTED: acylamino-acid-releasing enzyme-like [Amphimedon queenslandica]|eukprot:XP_019853672.1 PREDICTED: acylamino-acid-releasing enzyme-like [Amphimedon queenslandica]
MYFHDCQKLYKEIMRLDVNTKSISCITSDTEKGAYAVFDVFDGLLLGQYANPAQPRKIFIAELPSSNDGFKDTDFCEIATTTVSISDNIKWEVLSLTREDSGGYPYEALFVSPRVVESLPPLIVSSHGGPHMSSVADFTVWTACFIGLGYSVVFVNYNGSTGYGQDFMKSLLGNVGTLDVNDVQFAAESLVKRGSVDASRVFAHGGSHGGSLSVHLVSQFPDFYKATFVRNPVINIASMRNETDIINWTHSVTGLSYDPKVTPTPDQYSKMLEISPIVHAHKIKGAVTLAVGAEDHRCHPSQARELYTLLHAQGKDVNMFLYPDYHPLMSVDTDADCFMHCVLLFNKYS